MLTENWISVEGSKVKPSAVVFSVQVTLPLASVLMSLASMVKVTFRLMPVWATPSTCTVDWPLTAVVPPWISKETELPPNSSLMALATSAASSR